jgi:hypothetical protein
MRKDKIDSLFEQRESVNTDSRSKVSDIDKAIAEELYREYKQ